MFRCGTRHCNYPLANKQANLPQTPDKHNKNKRPATLPNSAPKSAFDLLRIQ